MDAIARPRGRPRGRGLLLTLALLLPLALPWRIRWDDVALYQAWGEKWAAGLMPYGDFAVEYPPGALLAVALPAALATVWGQFHFFFLVWAFCADTATRLWLWPWGRGAAVRQALYTALCLPLYVVHLTRLDVFAAACASYALVALARCPRVWLPWAALAVGALIKLYPVLFFLPMALYARRLGLGPRDLMARAALFAVTALALPWALYQVVGPHSLDWVTYHQQRGLQVSSAYVAWHLLTTGVGQPLAHTFAFGAFEATAPWAAQACAQAPIWMLLMHGTTLGVLAPRLRRPQDLYRLALALGVALVLTAKVFSPQYMLWLVPLTMLSLPQRGRARGWALWALVFGAAALTGMLYPGETLMLGGQAKRQWALVGRTVLLAGAWLLLLGWPWCPPRRALTPPRVELLTPPRAKSAPGVPHANP